MTAGPAAAPTLLDLIALLRETYTDEGVVTWLMAPNRGMAAGIYNATPAEWIKAGRLAEVYALATRIEGGG
jgi:hypothetical protein